MHNSGSVDESAAVCLACLPERNHLLVGLASGTLVLYNLAKQTTELRLRGHAACVTAVAFLGDGVHFASAGADNTLRLWDALSGLQVSSTSPHSPRSLAWSHRYRIGR